MYRSAHAPQYDHLQSTLLSVEVAALFGLSFGSGLAVVVVLFHLFGYSYEPTILLTSIGFNQGYENLCSKTLPSLLGARPKTLNFVNKWSLPPPPPPLFSWRTIQTYAGIFLGSSTHPISLTNVTSVFTTLGLYILFVLHSPVSSYSI